MKSKKSIGNIGNAEGNVIEGKSDEKRDIPDENKPPQDYKPGLDPDN